MSIITIYSSSALGPGSDLWVAPHFTVSHWTRKLDWYLNFQVQKNFSRLPQQTSATLRRILIENEMIPFTFDFGEDLPLLVASENGLPNRYFLVLPPIESFKDWLDLTYLKWNELGQPSLRVFLPPQVDENDFRKIWLKKTSDAFDISLVTDTVNRPTLRD